MPDELHLLGYREPLGLWVRRVSPPERHPGLRTERFEYTSRGDRVTGRLWRPRGGGDRPLVLLQHPEERCAEDIGADWVRQGAAVAGIDLPLHGRREDHKLAARLAPNLARTGSAAGDALAVEVARQAVIDLERALDALVSLDGIDPDRIAYAGFRLGAAIGTAFCALDPRPRAAALACTGAGLGVPGIDPGGYVARIAPRPLLLVHARRDDGVPREAAEALARAAREPVKQLWFDAGSGDLPDAATAAIWEFLAGALGLAPGR
jgi:dienelactone hydrolase